jgi:hypothetical protein
MVAEGTLRVEKPPTVVNLWQKLQSIVEPPSRFAA